MKNRLALVLALLIAVLCTANAGAQPAFPSSFKTRTVTLADGASIFVRSGGAGPAVVLIHGFGDTGDMWIPLAADLMRDHTVIVPDLRVPAPEVVAGSHGVMASLEDAVAHVPHWFPTL